jgi:hypothetical protein
MTSRSTQPFELRVTSRRARPLLLVVLGLLQAARALSQPPAPIPLEWSAPQECPEADEVRARVRKLAGTTQTAGAPLRAEATVARRPDAGFHLHLVVHAGDLVGEREIDGKSCSDLAGATAVALALLLRSPVPLTADDLTGSATSSADAGGEAASSSVAQGEAMKAATSPSATAASEAATSSASSSPQPQRAWRGLIQAPLLMIGVGPLHRPSYGLSLAAGMSLGRWLWLAEGRAWLPQRTSAVIEAERYAADVQRFAAGLRGCHSFLWPRFQIAPCLALSAEHMSARGNGPHIAESEARTTWLAVGFGVQARLPLTRWLNLLAGVELQIQTSRPKIAIDDVGLIEQLLPVAAGFTLGSEWIL